MSGPAREPLQMQQPGFGGGVALTGIGPALRSLRQTSSPAALFRQAARALSREAGFARAAVFSLRDHALTPESVCARGDLDEGDRLWLRVAGKTVRLGPWQLESEVLRRRTVVLVEDAPGNPHALALLPDSRSYVVAPVTYQAEAIALIHADHGASGPPVTELDRAALWAFSEGLSYALERSTLEERLRRHSERGLALARSAEASVEELVNPAIALPRPVGRSSRGQPRIGPGRGPLEMLTPREHEVLVMLADGETNARIAQRLVVSEDTVKTHVKHILRKLGVRNRSQAVSRYFRTPRARAGGGLVAPPAGAG